MLILWALAVAAVAGKPSTIDEFLAQPIPEHAKHLTSQALVDYVNRKQPFFKAKYSPDAEEFVKSRIMDSKYHVTPRSEDVMKDVALDVDLPESFDAREHWQECKSIIGYIRDQSKCGSTWAVSAAAVMSDRVCVQSNGTMKVHISDEDILTCCGYCTLISGCRGGYQREAFRYFENEGVCTGGRYREKHVCKPYSFYPCGVHGNQTYYGPCPEQRWDTPKCRRTCYHKYTKAYKEDKIFGKNSYYVPRNETLIRQEIIKNGPVAGVFTIFEDFSYYKGGIYVYTAGKEIGSNGIIIIGWGTENGTDYWLAANTWNTDWGENGYFRILRGTNHCSVERSILAGMIRF